VTWPTDALFDAVLAGFYLFVGVYHALLYLRGRSLKAYFWLALLCLGALTVNLTALMRHVPAALAWTPLFGVINHWGVAAATVFLYEFAAALCERRPGRGGRILEGGIVLLGLLSAPERTGWFRLFLVVVLGSIAVTAWTILRAARAGHPEARTVAWGISAIGAALMIDVLMTMNILPKVQGLPFIGFTLLFLSMAVSLSNRFERAHRELDALRVDLERRVEERTRALNGANRRLRRYFPARVVERILSSGEDLRPRTERREMTVLFADLVDFTAFSDGADPRTVSALLNEYITAMLEEIEARRGTLDKVMGDGLMAFWGAPAPMPPEEQARLAVETGAAMQRRLASLGEGWTARGLPRFQARVGVHQGWAAVGDIGTADLWSFTAIGQGVNIAARLERLCPPGKVLISDAVRVRLGGDGFAGRPLGLRLKGVQEEMKAWVLDP